MFSIENGSLPSVFAIIIVLYVVTLFAFVHVRGLRDWMGSAYLRFVNALYALYLEALADRNSRPKQLEYLRKELRGRIEETDAVLSFHGNMKHMRTAFLILAAYIVFCLGLECKRWIYVQHARSIREDRLKREASRA